VRDLHPQDAGLGHVTHLTRIEWSFVRTLIGRPRRLSAAFLAAERAKLAAYRHEVRTLRQLQLTGAATSGLELDVSANGSMQMAVGQRVTALHPKERHLFTGTVLTPDGNHYRIQFDRQKHGVQLVRDVLVMPLLDGSRGIDFTSPHGLGLHESSSPWEGGKTDGGSARQPSPTPPLSSAVVQADPKELQLLAYVLRLLERKQLLMGELKAVCTEAERELRRLGVYILGAVESGSVTLHVAATALQPPPVRVEVTAAQQRVLGQVPSPPEVPALGGLLTQLRATSVAEAQKLERHVAIWRQEIEWLQDELRSTARALDTALAALRPTAQRFSLALGAAAPEPQSRGLGVTYCAELRDNAAERTASVLSSVLAARAEAGVFPSPQLRDTLCSAVSLLLQVETWANAPMSPAECRAGLLAALKKLTPLCDANRSKFADVMATAQQLVGRLVLQEVAR